MSDSDVVVEQVVAPVTWALRQRALRPHQSIGETALPGDEDREAGHFAAYDWAGRVVGTASVRPEAPPWDDASDGRPWRLRGMATDEQWRGRGVGALVLARVVEHVARGGGGLLWCNARVPALGFYARAGFVPHGEGWDDPDTGPHVQMSRLVAPWQH